MKKILIYIVFLMSYAANACDICGCGASSFYLGIMPQFHQNFVGLRYRYQSYDSHLSSSLFRSQEIFQSSEILARVYLRPRWQVLGIVPYHFNTQITQNQNKYLSGLGDITILSNYQILNLSDSVWKHQFWAGLGFKSPTGRYNYSNNSTEIVANPNFQLGTGSWDFFGQINYTLRYRNWGWTTDISYRLNRENSQNYRFGNRILGQSNVFWIRQMGNWALMPSTGIIMDFAQKDLKNGLMVANTGGKVAFMSWGLDLFYKKMSFGMSLQKGFLQDLAQGEILARERYNFSLAYLF